MPSACSAYGCANHSMKVDCINRKVSYHNFPHSNKSLMKEWMAKLRRENFVPTIHTKICSDHFEPECFTFQKTTNYRRLKANSVPTIFSFTKNTSKKKRTPHTVGSAAVNNNDSVPGIAPGEGASGSSASDEVSLAIVNELGAIMPTSCCAIGCSNHAYKKACIDRKVSFHKFPKDPLLKKAWLFEMRRQDFKPSWTTKICSDHFEQDCFTYQKNTNRRCLVKDALPTIFSFSKKDKTKSSNDTRTKTASVPNADANGELQFVGYLPGREPRGQAQRKTFKDFIMSKEASEAQSKLTETNERLAVLHKRKLKLKPNAKPKPFLLSESSTLLYPPYESHFVNYKGKSSSSSSKKRPLITKLTPQEPLNDSSVVDDPPVEENSSSDEESSNQSVHLSSEESWRESPLNSDESSSSALHQPTEVNLCSDESNIDSPPYKNVSVRKKESETTSALQESNLSSDENSQNLVTFISKLSSPISSIASPKESENVMESADFQKLLTPLDNDSGDEKSHKLPSKESAGLSSNQKLFKFKHRIQPSILKQKDSSILAKHLDRKDPAHIYYLKRLAKDLQANVETSDALFSNSFRWEIANFKGKLNERHARARKEKMKLMRKIKYLRRNNQYWKRKNETLKKVLERRDVKKDA